MNLPPLVFDRQILAEQDNQTAIELLARSCPEVSKQKLKLAMKYGAVWFAESSGKNKPQRLRRAKRNIPIGASLFIYYNERVLFSSIQPAQLVADQGSYSVWNKPSGMFSQGTKWGDHTAIPRWVELFGFELEKLSHRETFLVHRLDRATNGLIIIAHTKLMASKLADLFETRTINKQYCAVVDGHFAVDQFTTFETPIDDRQALTKILSVDYCPHSQQTFLQIGLETGRKHQIRKHLAAVGFPVKNDYLYGTKTLRSVESDHQLTPNSPCKDLLLRSFRLEFVCPENGREVRFEIPRYTP